MEPRLTDDTQAVLLLCGELGQRGSNGPKPLTLRQYNTLASWLKSEGMRPGDLLGEQGRACLEGNPVAVADTAAVRALLDRGAALALIAEKWERSGLWAISRSDAGYPERLKQYLGQSAPPLLYGVGSSDLLNRGGLAVVGSRDRSEEDGEFAHQVGEHCAAEGIPVISGAAKGIDRDAMSGALEAGGGALGVLAEGLARTATSGQYRSDLVNERLTLVSPYDPDSRWFAYAAMERNKLLYGLSEAALVVASADESGGTWAGATEALRLGRVKVFVKTTGTVAPGNSKLLRKGGVAFPAAPWNGLREMFTAPDEANGNLFAGKEQEQGAGANGTTSPAEERVEAAARQAESQRPNVFIEREKPATEVPSAATVRAAYSLVIGELEALLREPRTADWLAEKMEVRRVQMTDWLDQAVREGRFKKLKKPVRYQANGPSLFDR